MRLLSAVLISVSPVLSAGETSKADLNLKALDGQRVRLSDYRGKVVVLNFWATWCVPCTVEIPMLVRAERDYAPNGVIFIAASVDDRKSKKNVPDFVAKYHIGFPVWQDATVRDLLRFGMGTAVPATAFLDQEGHIVFRIQGQISDEELRERLERLLAVRFTPAPQGIVTH